MTTKSRFCPSPTGFIHLGNARTALFNTLIARRDSGTFLLRIEDTDQERSKPEYTEKLMQDLCWLNCDWQEGAGAGGEHEPYWQSQRTNIYDKYYQQLIESKHAYPCFCTEDQLALSRKIQRSRGQPPRYPGTCRNLTADEQQAKFDAGEQATLRFYMPDDVTIEFNDLVKGVQSFAGQDIGDFIIRRANGTASFMFCNAIDDSLMGVTHAIRGEDHLTNTPRQIAILNALNLRLPGYGHISLILGQDGSPLSKRNGSRSISDLRQQGYLPLAVVNYLARLGHYYENTHFMSFEQLAAQFKNTSLSNSPARFDEQQLLHWQKEAIAEADGQQLWQWMGESVHKLIPQDKQTAFVELVKPNVLFPADALHWAEILFGHELNLSTESQQVINEADNQLFLLAINAVEQFSCDFKSILDFIKENTTIKGKQLFQPLRVALTGQLHGPEMAPIVSIMGKELVKKRFEQFVN
jgi:glutamyl-tRNA synthetase